MLVKVGDEVDTLVSRNLYIDQKGRLGQFFTVQNFRVSVTVFGTVNM